MTEHARLFSGVLNHRPSKSGALAVQSLDDLRHDVHALAAQPLLVHAHLRVECCARRRVYQVANLGHVRQLGILGGHGHVEDVLYPLQRSIRRDLQRYGLVENSIPDAYPFSCIPAN